MSILEEWSNAATVIVAVEAENKRLRAERDQLLAACKIAMSHAETNGNWKLFSIIRDAISAVESAAER